MHGIVHKAVKEYIIDTAGQDTWTTVADRADIDSTLYLPVSHYDDGEINALIEAFTESQDGDRTSIERAVGKHIAAPLLSTFSAHLRDEWGLFELLTHIDSVTASVDETTADTTVPDVSCELTDDHAIVTYRSDRDYCTMAHGLLEGIVEEYDVATTVTKTACIHDGDEVCTFHVDRV